MAESLKQAPHPDDIYDALDMPQGEWVDPAELTDGQEAQEAPAKPSPATIAPFVAPKRPSTQVKHEAPANGSSTEVTDEPEADDAASGHAEYTYDERRTRQLAKLLDRALEQEVPTSQKNAQQAARSLKEVAQRISWDDDGVATIRDQRGKGNNKSFVDTPINPEVAADLVDAAKAGTKQWGFDEETQQRNTANEPSVAAVKQTTTENAANTPEALAAPVQENGAVNDEKDPLTAPISEVRKSTQEPEPTPEHETAQIYLDTKADQEEAYVPRHAKRAHAAGEPSKTGENTTDLSGEAGVKAAEKAFEMIIKAAQEDRRLTIAEQDQLADVVEAMDKYGFEGQLHPGVVDSLRSTDDYYEALAKKEDEAIAAKEAAASGGWRSRFSNAFKKVRDLKDRWDENVTDRLSGAYINLGENYRNYYNPENPTDRRRRQAMLLAGVAVVGLAGARLYSMWSGKEISPFVDELENGARNGSPGGSVTDGTQPEDTSESTAEVVETEPTNFEVRKNDGITHTIFRNSGEKLPKGATWEIFTQLNKEGLISDEHIKGTSLYTGDDGFLRYANQGEAEFSAELTARMNELTEEALKAKKSR